MAKTPKHTMTRQECEDWDAVYEYMKKLLGYDENQMLPRSVVLRLKGMLNGKFMARNDVPDNAHYSYQVLLITLKYSTPAIQRALNNVRFDDESHKVNYIMRIVENNINTVYMRMKNASVQKKKAVEIASSEVGTKDVEYKPKKKADKNDRFSNLW